MCIAQYTNAKCIAVAQMSPTRKNARLASTCRWLVLRTSGWSRDENFCVSITVVSLRQLETSGWNCLRRFLFIRRLVRIEQFGART
jgi:hypothetical protein